MEVNYHNEDISSPIFNIIVYIFISIIIIAWGIGNEAYLDIGGMIFMLIMLLILIIPLIFSIRDFKRKLKARKTNLNIMQNGRIIRGIVYKIYDNYSFHPEKFKKNHNVTAEIRYKVNDEVKTVVVDKICVNVQTINKYLNKEINIYVYDDMKYIDILN